MTLSVFQMLEVSGRALSAQRTRLDVVSSNLANAQTTRTEDGGPYKRKEVMLSAVPVASRFRSALTNAMDGGPSSVEVSEVRADEKPGRRVYEPDHPDAGSDGYVEYPNINTVEEMVDMITVMRTYEANLNVSSAMRDMASRALNLGRPV